MSFSLPPAPPPSPHHAFNGLSMEERWARHLRNRQNMIAGVGTSATVEQQTRYHEQLRGQSTTARHPLGLTLVWLRLRELLAGQIPLGVVRFLSKYTREHEPSEYHRPEASLYRYSERGNRFEFIDSPSSSLSDRPDSLSSAETVVFAGGASSYTIHAEDNRLINILGRWISNARGQSRDISFYGLTKTVIRKVYALFITTTDAATQITPSNNNVHNYASVISDSNVSTDGIQANIKGRTGSTVLAVGEGVGKSVGISTRASSGHIRWSDIETARSTTETLTAVRQGSNNNGKRNIPVACPAFSVPNDLLTMNGQVNGQVNGNVSIPTLVVTEASSPSTSPSTSVSNAENTSPTRTPVPTRAPSPTGEPTADPISGLYEVSFPPTRTPVPTRAPSPTGEPTADPISWSYGVSFPPTRTPVPTRASSPTGESTTNPVANGQHQPSNGFSSGSSGSAESLVNGGEAHTSNSREEGPSTSTHTSTFPQQPQGERVADNRLSPSDWTPATHEISSFEHDLDLALVAALQRPPRPENPPGYQPIQESVANQPVQEAVANQPPVPDVNQPPNVEQGGIPPAPPDVEQGAVVAPRRRSIRRWLGMLARDFRRWFRGLPLTERIGFISIPVLSLVSSLVLWSVLNTSRS
ncbi:hypothetical protein F5Y00DRAFT_161686 [Daldinia vernicosa]|uniref:uncharacterized protein n=1 Tax=Daldinia vernicosa TaxID=114800 RepID=UPI002007577E|nr:uncharacterized protein F5Y00DRAFT_161686 [Daldinia vernicosa]KAI0845873.1 hypothetical protein F5Y00DRAFT_161686 [Daldinia vernicosa]